MTEHAKERDGAPSGHITAFACEHVAEARAMRLAWPGMTSEQIAADLGGKVTAGAVRQWRNGIRPIPGWVCDHMRARAQATLQAIAGVIPGKGKASGARALATWRAAQAAKR